jgi:hypothetical protein
MPVAKWDPLPEHADYAATWGLTPAQYDETVAELRNREAVRPRTGGLALAQYLDTKLNGFIEERARQLREPKRAGSRRAAQQPPPRQSDEIDLSGLTDEDREFFGDSLNGLD